MEINDCNYKNLVKMALSVMEDEEDTVVMMANLSALIYNEVDRLNWAGFYRMRENTLVLGPFQGKMACTRIKAGKGVCGSCVLSGKTVTVDDVHLFPGHIACDCSSNSEIVIPVRSRGKIIGVLDIDSPVKSRFGEIEKNCFKNIVGIMENRLEAVGAEEL